MSAHPSSSTSATIGTSVDADDTTTTSSLSSKKDRHSRTSSLLPSLNSLGSFLSAGLSTADTASTTKPSSGILSTDAELMISHPSPTEWADESPVRTRFRRDSSRNQDAKGATKSLSEEVRFRGSASRQQSNIAFPSPATSEQSGRPTGSRTSSTASTAEMETGGSSEPGTSSNDTPATSVRFSPPGRAKELPNGSPPPPSETTIKAESSTSTSAYYSHQTLPRSFASRTSPSKDESQDSAYGRRSSLGAITGRNASTQLDEALSSDEKTVQRQAGFRARSINSIRGLAAAWVPARFVSQPSSSASETSSDDLAAPDATGSRRKEGLALTKVDGEKGLVKHNDAKRPVKLDRRRLDKAVSLAVEAAQAAEEDERIWEEKQRAKRTAQKSNSARARPALKQAWSSSSDHNDADRQVARSGSRSDADGGMSSEEEAEDDLGFSLDLYISSLGYLISAISDKEAPGLSTKQKADIRQRLEEGMSKLGFDARAELEQAQALKHQLELEREKLLLQRQHSYSAPATPVIHHHYHTAVPSGSWMGDAGNFSRAHAAAKASGKGSSSLAGKIGSSVLDVGLHIGAGALSALSANLSAIAPRGAKSGAEVKEDVRITDLENGEDLQNVASAGDASPRPMSQPGSGAATPRTAWTRAISQNNKQWELAVAFASTAASALASSLGAVARDEPPTAVTTTGPLTHEEQVHLARYGHLDTAHTETAEDRLILLSASLARALKRSPLPTQLYQLLRQLVSILAAIDSKYSLTEKGTQLAVRETSRAMRFVRKHDLHVKAVRVAWAAAEAAVAALEAYRDERGWMEAQGQGRIGGVEGGNNTPMYGASPPKEMLAIADRLTVEERIDDAERRMLDAAKEGNKENDKVRYA